MTANCPVCGEPFERRKSAMKYCSDECRKLIKQQRERKKPGKKLPVKKTLSDICAEAGKLGLTYGKYMEYLAWKEAHR